MSAYADGWDPKSGMSHGAWQSFVSSEPSCHLASDECEGNCEQCPRCDRDACEAHRYKEVLCLECAEAIGLIGESARFNAIRALAADELPIAEFRELCAVGLVEDLWGVL